MSEKKSPLGVVRPRSPKSQQAICAAWKLLETTTYQGFVAIQAIALMIAGVGKTTISRWWSSKTSAVIDVFMKKVTPITFRETRSATEALTAQVASIVKAFSGDYGRIVL